MLGGDDHHCVKHFLEWLGRTSPCLFARQFVSDKKTEKTRIVCLVVLDDFDAADVRDIDSAFDEAARKRFFAALLFPRLRTADELTRTLRTLLSSPRWSCRAVPWGRVARAGDRPIAVGWQTRDGALSSAMGFAPLGSMPVTRRGPYFGIVVWPGGNENRIMRSPNGVGFIDGAHRLRKGPYKKTFKATTARVRELFGDPLEDPVQLRDVGFCLPSKMADLFLAGCSRHS